MHHYGRPRHYFSGKETWELTVGALFERKGTLLKMVAVVDPIRASSGFLFTV